MKQVKLEAGKLYAIRLDYHEFLNDADISPRLVAPRRSRQALERSAKPPSKPPIPSCSCSASRRASKAKR